MAYVDFEAIKKAVSIDQVADWLSIKLKPQSNGQLRGLCPLCEKGDERSFVITPSKGLYFCFKGCGGGDILQLTARMKGCSTREAAVEISEHFSVGNSNGSTSTNRSTVPATTPKGPKSGTLEPLKPLEHLTTDHPAIEALGLSVPVCEALGIGFASKGIMKGRVVFPLRLQDGTLVGYQGLATSPDQAPLILFPKNLAERISTPVPEQAAPTGENVVDFKSFYRAS